MHFWEIGLYGSPTYSCGSVSSVSTEDRDVPPLAEGSSGESVKL